MFKSSTLENNMRICVVSFILFVVCHLGKAQLIQIDRKKISFEILCKEVNWAEHTQKSCSAVDIKVESLDADIIPLTNLTFAKEITRFLDPQSLEETCFQIIFPNAQIREMKHSELVVRSSNYREANNFIYDMVCTETRIQRYDAKFENKSPDGCSIKPLGIEDDCRSKNIWELIQVETKLQKLDETHFHVISRSIKKNESRDETDCVTIPKTLLQLNFSGEFCDFDIFIPPIRNFEIHWNLYAWQKCSKLAFGEQVLHLDWKFDRWVLNNLTSLCGKNLPKMDSCLKENALSKTPSLESFNFYSKLRKSYDDICANKNDFSEGHRCFQSIQSDKAMKAAYVSEVKKCSAEGSSDVCTEYSKNVLCKAFAQYKVYSNCTSFQVTYKYKRIIEDRNNARGNCSSTQIDPCSPKDPKYIDICSSGPQIEVSFLFLMMVCLASWMNSIN